MMKNKYQLKVKSKINKKNNRKQNNKYNSIKKNKNIKMKCKVKK